MLVVEQGQGTTATRRAYYLASATLSQAPPVTARSASLAAVLQAAALALLGGLILNLMPCVFPVLSIKVLGLIEQAGQSRARVRRARARLHGRRAGGVRDARRRCCSPCAPAGTQVGWGFQLQSPATVAILAYVLFAVG